MHGTILLTTEFGTGTKMTVVVPLRKMSADFVPSPAPPDRALLGPDINREKTWILVVDDNQLNAEIISKLLLRSESSFIFPLGLELTRSPSSSALQCRNSLERA